VASFRSLADDLGRQSITIEANANDEGHLYGSVGAPEIVKALKQHDFTITADQVRLKGPLKELGLYTVQIHLGQEIEGELKVWVVPMVSDQEHATEPKPAEPKPPHAGARGLRRSRPHDPRARLRRRGEPRALCPHAGDPRRRAEDRSQPARRAAEFLRRFRIDRRGRLSGRDGPQRSPRGQRRLL